MAPFLLIALLLAPLCARASSSDTKWANVWLNPAGALFNYMNGGVDLRLGQKLTVGPSAGVFGKSKPDISVTGTGLGLRTNFYPENAIKKGWRGSFIFYSSPMKASTASGEARFSNLILQGMAGYQLLYGWFSVGASAGVAYYSADPNIVQNNQSYKMPAFSGIGPAVELMIACTL